MQKNIIIVNDFAHINGGVGQVALTSAVKLAESGHRVIVFSAVGPVMPALVCAGVHVIVTGQHEILLDPNRLRAATQGLWNLNAQKAMAELLKTLDPANTIIHLHSWTKALSASVIRTAIRHGFKVTCTLHDYFSACPNGGFFDYQRKTICKEKPLSFGCISRNCDARSYPQKLWRVARQGVQNQFGLMPSGLKHFITISDFSEAILKPFLPKDATVYRVENPINAVRQDCVNAGANAAFTFVGRLTPDKGVAMFAAAASQLGLAPTFVGAGECNEEIKNICPKARMTGWVSSDQVIENIIAARALVLPSLVYETQGLVVAEAAALGVPAIVPDTCAARDMVEDGCTGLWFRGGDETDLRDKISQLQQPELAAKLGRAAYERYWKKPWTMEAHVAKLVNCYDHILS